MARAFGRILSSIWDDEDFLALDPCQQRLYMFLLSQPNLNHAGLLPLTFKRWSDTAHGLTAAKIRDDLIILEQARFIVLDFDREELLVRSLVRRDDVWKAPRVMGAMVSNAMEIRSRKLRAVLLSEVDRLPLDELSSDPGKNGSASIRTQVDAHIAQLRKAYGSLPPPTEPSRTGRPEGDAEPPQEPLSEPPSEGDGEGDTQGHPQASTRVRASPQARALPLPLPLPLPVAPARIPLGAPSARGDVAEPVSPAQLTLIPGFAADEPPQRDEAPETEGQRINRLTRIYTDLVPLCAFLAAQGIVRKAVRSADGEGRPLYSDGQIADGLRLVAKEKRSLTAGTLRVAIEGIPGQRTSGGGHTPYQNPTDPNAYRKAIS